MHITFGTESGEARLFQKKVQIVKRSKQFPQACTNSQTRGKCGECPTGAQGGTRSEGSRKTSCLHVGRHGQKKTEPREIYMRILGLDYGSVTVGVAVSDALLITAQPVEVIKRKSETKLRQTLARLEEIIAEYEVDKIVLGYPKNMNNTLGERVERTEEFKEKLEKRTGLEVVLWDERLTTVSAMEVLKEGGVRRENRKAYVDKIAAVFILQGYLDSLR